MTGRVRALSGDLAIAVAALVVLALLPTVFASKALVDFVIRGSAFALFATSLNLLVGYAGQISLGHAAFFAIGGYSSAILASRYEIHGIIALLMGAALAGTLAFLVARPILRLSGHYLAMATLGSFNLPLWPVYIILGIDALMDMARTSVNLVGNCLASAVMARWEGELNLASTNPSAIESNASLARESDVVK